MNVVEDEKSALSTARDQRTEGTELKQMGKFIWFIKLDQHSVKTEELGKTNKQTTENQLAVVY